MKLPAVNFRPHNAILVMAEFDIGPVSLVVSLMHCRIMGDANMGHAYDGLLWTLRYVASLLKPAFTAH